MSGEVIRFLHASDFHLEQPLYGLASVPDHLRELLIDAPYQAATRVFDTAILEHVDFVLLAGDLADLGAAGPRAIAFLLEQFERLNEKGIAVYWAGGKVDGPETWPSAVPLPDNVHLFASSRVEELIFYRNEQSHAAILGASWTERNRVHATDLRGDTTERFKIGVLYGQYDAGAMMKQPMQYWALGGDHQRKTLFAAPNTAHFAGTPQGRCPDEPGPHGCTLVSIDADGKVRTQLLPTDVVRWHHERLTVSDAATRGDLQRLLKERLQMLATENGERCLLVSWLIEGATKLATALRHGGLAEELVSELRNDFGSKRYPAWTVSLELEPPVSLPGEWYEEDSILGDYLRAIRDREANETEPLQISTFLPEHHALGALGSALAVTDSATRTRVLREAALLGVDLLRGGE